MVLDDGTFQGRNKLVMKTLEEVLHKHCSANPCFGHESQEKAIRQWIKERLPKEKTEKDYVFFTENEVYDYNQALKDVRKALGEE